MDTAMTIHLGLHKTGSTFMQRYFFPLHSDDLGYVDLRSSAHRFLSYILYCNELEWDAATARSLLEDELRQADRPKSRHMLISDEQFCGSPWDNASSRKRSFDRLHQLFSEARYLIVLRNQEDLVQSLYLQYVKTGGSASWKEFLTYDRHPLQFALKSYLNYGVYLKYILSRVGQERVGCFLYEDMTRDPVAFCRKMAEFLKIESKEGLNELVQRKANKSISPVWVNLLIQPNKFCKSERQPFLLLPGFARRAILRLAIRLSFSRKKNSIPENVVAAFCREAKSCNSVLRDLVGRDISGMGY